MTLRATLAALAVLLAPAASAATITVTTLDDERNADGDCSLREAIEAANTDTAIDACTAGDDTSSSDRIEFATTLLGGTVTLTVGGLEITEFVVLDGETSAATQITIDGAGTYQILRVGADGATITNLTLTNGLAASGGALYLDGSGATSISNVTFTSNVATGASASEGGGAVFMDGAMGSFNGCTFTSNAASGASGSGGALFGTAADLGVSGSTFTSNTASRAGGAIELQGGSVAFVGDTDFSNNVTGPAPGNGGAIHTTGSNEVTVQGGSVVGNVAASEGGGFWHSPGSPMIVTGTSFTGNQARGDAADNGGGAVFNNGGRVELVGITATANAATGTAGSGGALFNTAGGLMTVVSSTISQNQAPRAGGGLEDAGGTVAIVMSTFDANDVTGNAAPGNGGGVHTGGGTVVVVGGTYANNVAVEGGGLWTSGTLTITDDPDAIPGDVRPSGTMPAITAPVVTGNTATGADADQGGGGLYATPSGVLTVDGATVSDNEATGAAGSGGGVFSAGMLTIERSTVSGNAANRAGGGVEDANGMVVLTDVTLTGNRIATAAPGNGGGLHSGGGDVMITRGVVSNNTAVEGGGLWASGSLTINGGAGMDMLAGDGTDDGTDDAGTDRSAEDAAYIGGDRTGIADVSGNTATGADAGTGGGGIYVETGGELSVRYGSIAGNAATGTAGSGGGILVADGASARVALTEIRENAANRAGGGVELFDDPATTDAAGATSTVLRGVLLHDNRIATAAPGNGGGVHVGGAGVLTVQQSAVVGNEAREGAGLWIAGAGTASVENTTVSSNAATEDGGGIYDNGGATIDVASSTVALNMAGGDGGGLVSQGTTFSFQNTVVAGNTAGGAGPDCSGTFDSGDFNLVQSTDGCTVAGSLDDTITGTDPMLGPLADNGGPTPTHLPMAGSPLVDNGESTFAVDQRGLGRGQAQAAPTPDDIGAVESDGRPVATDGSGAVTSLALLPVRPNPAAGRAEIAFTVAEAAPATVEVFSVLGQRVLVAFDGEAAPGRTLTADVDLSALAAGVYLVRLDAGGEVTTRQLTVVR